MAVATITAFKTIRTVFFTPEFLAEIIIFLKTRSAAKTITKYEYTCGVLEANIHNGKIIANPTTKQTAIKKTIFNNEKNLELVFKFILYYSSEIASEGHAPAQVPQLMQVPASITRLSPCSEIAETGHSPSQAPQFTQASEIL